MGINSVHALDRVNICSRNSRGRLIDVRFFELYTYITRIIISYQETSASFLCTQVAAPIIIAATTIALMVAVENMSTNCCRKVMLRNVTARIADNAATPVANAGFNLPMFIHSMH